MREEYEIPRNHGDDEKWERELRDAGREEGREEARREDFTFILRARFGVLGASVRERLETVSSDQLGRWIKRAVAAERIDDVFDPTQSA